MAHEIYENDSMFSVRQRPWHGLGIVIEEYPDISEAIIASGLDWDAELRPMYTTYNDITIPIKDNSAIVRTDTNDILGVVGSKYSIYQNSEMWAFIERFQEATNIKLETAGSLRNGRTTWILAKHDMKEIIKGDPIEEFFLFRNSFDGSTPISCMFTNIRVVCNNTLSFALKTAENIHNIRHTKNADLEIKEVEKALKSRHDYQMHIQESLEILAKCKMNATETKFVLEKKIFPVNSVSDYSKRGETLRENKIDEILELVETGAGTNIIGVRGTAYGLFQAIVEWIDHEKTVKTTKNRPTQEAKFENAFFSSGTKIKQDCFDRLMKYAA